MVNAPAAPDRRSRLSTRSRFVGIAAAGALVVATMAVGFGSVVAPRPELEAAQQTVATGAEFTVGAPHLQTVAQGIITIDGPVVWRMRETTIPLTTETEAPNATFVVQRTGNSIYRNDLTSRRMRLEPGEAIFLPPGDPASRTAVGTDPSVVWNIELVPAAAAAVPGTGTTLFSSDPIPDYPVGTFDIELQRTVLLPGEVSELPGHIGPAVVVVASGRVQVSAVGQPPQPMGAGAGFLALTDVTIRNGDTLPASFLVAMIGDGVDGSEGITVPVTTSSQTVPSTLPTPVTGQPTQAPLMQTPVPVPTTPPTMIAATMPPVVQPTAPPVVVEPTVGTDVQPSDGDTDGDGLSDAEEAAYNSDPLNKDYDADGLLDGFEVYQTGTDPLNNDTDGDGLLDGEEINVYGTSPASGDSDGDGLTDGEEIYTYGTGPAYYDTDGDGYGDGDEVYTFGTSPLDPASYP